INRHSLILTLSNNFNEFNINFVGNLDDELQNMYKNLLLNSQAQDEDKEKEEKPWSSVKPTPGCCIKTKNLATNEKVFINVCTSSTIPIAESITENELISMLDKLENPDEIVNYRIPMSIGEAHAEIDNQGKGCIAYDVIINPNYLHTINNSKVFFGFFMSVVFEGLSQKYQIELDRNWILLRNKKFLGRIEDQNIRKRNLIQEMQSTQNKPLISEIKENIKKPKFEIVREPETGHPDFLVAEIQLPGVKKASSILVDIGEDRLVICTRPKQYLLDVFLPYDLLQEECGSQFDVSSSCLTITMPVQPQ
uniref:PIH1 domain-containing protein 1 n=1 Tax=Ciona savignyi TaxID=51511 RepID=H2YDQ5_CIOSA